MLCIVTDDIPRAAWIGLALCVLYPLLTIIYNLTLHPLARFPGPLLWRSTRLVYMYSMWSGRAHIDYHQMHKKYGAVIRIAPNELSFADTAAWGDIYSNRGGSLAFPKTTVWHGAQAGRANALLNALDRDEHAWMRKKMEPGFVERDVASQEGIIQGYVDLFIQQLRESAAVAKSSGNDGVVLDVAQWFTFVFLDIIGDLAFGEDFDCLRKGQMNEWMALLFGSIKLQVLFATLRHYPWIIWVLEGLIPTSVKEKANHHWSIVEEKVNRRMAKDIERPDFIELWEKAGKGKDGMSMGNIYSNAFVMTFAGSETLATTLSGTMYWLVKRPEKLALLKEELRSRFQDEEEMTFVALKEVPYLHAVLWEGFRMCNPSPIRFVRMTPPEGGMVSERYIAGNTFVSVNVVALAFDENRFVDANDFHPERWLPEATHDPHNRFLSDDRQAMQPFNVGPRSCIGKPLALAEMKLILARLVWAFDIEEANTPAGKLVWEEQKTYSLVEKHPFEVKLIGRKP